MTTAKSYEFDLHGLPVHITRRRTSRITLRVLPNRTISLSAPLSCTKRSLAQFLYSHEAHIAELLKDYQDHHDPRLASLQRSFANLEPQDTILWWGAPLSVAWSPFPLPAIRYSASAAEKSASSSRGGLSELGIAIDPSEHQVAFWGDAAQEGDQARALRQRLLRAELAEELKTTALRMLPEVEGALGVTVASVSCRAMTSRWGSCRYEKGRITLNLDLATHGPEALEMVLWHEACHLRVPNHGTAFKELLSSVCPQWKAISDQLDYEGMRLAKSPAQLRG